jgi:hypothetical protein
MSGEQKSHQLQSTSSLVVRFFQGFYRILYSKQGLALVALLRKLEGPMRNLPHVFCG